MISKKIIPCPFLKNRAWKQVQASKISLQTSYFIQNCKKGKPRKKGFASLISEDTIFLEFQKPVINRRKRNLWVYDFAPILLGLRMRIFLRLEKGFENLTRPATLHFIFPVLASTTTANCSVNKPTEVTCLKFPSRALFLNLRRTFLYNPTWFSSFIVLAFSGNYKKHLTFYVNRYFSPALLITVYCL